MIPASSHNLGCISSLGSSKGGSVGILMYQSISAILQIGKSTASGSLVVECFQPPLDVSGELCDSSYISSPGSVQFSGKICHRSIQISSCGGTLLDGGCLASPSSWHVGRHSLLIPNMKDLIMDGRGNLSVYNKCLPPMLKRMSPLVCSRWCTKQCYLCPYIIWVFD